MAKVERIRIEKSWTSNRFIDRGLIEKTQELHGQISLLLCHNSFVKTQFCFLAQLSQKRYNFPLLSNLPSSLSQRIKAPPCVVKHLSARHHISARDLNETCLFTLRISQYPLFKMHKSHKRPLQQNSRVNFSLRSLEISDGVVEGSSNWAAL